MASYIYSGGSQPPSHNKTHLEPLKKPVIITGGSGKLGRAVVKELNDGGWFTINLDVALPPAGADPSTSAKVFVKTDLTSMGEVLETMMQVDSRYSLHGPSLSVVHLAAIPMAGFAPNSTTMQNNTMSTYNIFEACRQLGVKNVDPVFPTVLPITEDSQPPRPESAYSLSKLLGEVTAAEYCRWEPGMKIVSMRFSNVMEISAYQEFKSEKWQDEKNHINRRWNAFGYIDTRDAACAIHLALEKDYKGHHIYLIANADTVFNTATAKLVKDHFPGVEWNEAAMRHPEGKFKGNEGLLDIGKARKELGWEPRYSWRD
ncbi:hypothetical protein FRB96_009692 [Tulasnella sp. 330]|nr:hypothetical protein FRB96_009692 [Tulasnella sp. 330]KAG8882186.1 hypothetical protein FRB97_008595 [Tulasnella sp. 331]